MKFAQSVETFLLNSEDGVLIDIRPQADYQRSHIPDAIGLPFPIKLKVLRKKYTPAIEECPLDKFIENTAQWKTEVLKYLNHGSILYIYCQVGGLRSFYFHKVFENHHSSLVFLEGGYEAYCLFQTQYFETMELSNLYVIRGNSGSGKTEIIEMLSKKGAQVIALSKLANHRGSAFGSYGDNAQPTSAQFQHELLRSCMELDFFKPVFVEQEGIFIGSVSIPEALFLSFQSAKTILLKVPRSSRVSYLLEQYVDCHYSVLMQGLKKIEARLNPADYQVATDYLLAGQKRAFVSLLLDYYDQSNSYQHDGMAVVLSINCELVDPDKMAALIIKNC